MAEIGGDIDGRGADGEVLLRFAGALDPVDVFVGILPQETGDAFADFLKKETVRVTDVLKSVGLVKS